MYFLASTGHWHRATEPLRTPAKPYPWKMLYDATHPKTIFTSSAPVPVGVQLVPESITMYQQLSDPYHVARVEATLALRNKHAVTFQ
jgi:hypothetical protein